MAVTKEVFIKHCTWCEEGTEIKAHEKDIKAWLDGANIARVMPYLTEDERELLISGTCPKCWNKMFGGEE